MTYALAATVAISLTALPPVVSAQTPDRSTQSGVENPPPPDPQAQAAPAEPSPFEGITFGVGFDGYYAWNTSRPVGRINLLRAYDVSSNSFSLNQATVIVERAPDVDKGRRMGLRLDLMYGQATETLQGSAANEPRPQVYRQLYQVYGSYVLPVGRGLQVDFGKFAGVLGLERQLHEGPDQLLAVCTSSTTCLSTTSASAPPTHPTTRVSLTHWLVNGAQQSEDFNGFKSQAAIITIKPVPSVSWSVNYYAGREARDLNLALNPGIPSLPTQPGLSVDPIDPFDRSRLHIFDTYATWTKDHVTLGAEADYVALRPESGASSIVKGGAAYAQYRREPAGPDGAALRVFRRSRRPVQRDAAEPAGRDRDADLSTLGRDDAARRMAS